MYISLACGLDGSCGAGTKSDSNAVCERGLKMRYFFWFGLIIAQMVVICLGAYAGGKIIKAWKAPNSDYRKKRAHKAASHIIDDIETIKSTYCVDKKCKHCKCNVDGVCKKTDCRLDVIKYVIQCVYSDTADAGYRYW